MTDHTRPALDPEVEALFAEAEELLEAMARSTARMEALAHQMLDAAAALEEWSC